MLSERLLMAWRINRLIWTTLQWPVDSVEIISPVVAKLTNISLRSQTYPGCLKISRVHPVYKNGDHSNPQNYRPISVPSIFAKIFEKVVLTQLLEYWDRHSLYSSTQYGFRPKHSTLGACVDLVEDV
jgi:hypothetical protein